MDGYSVTEAASILGVPTEKVWELIQALGLEGQGGLLRIGLVHYNTIDEVDRLVAALQELAA